VYHKAESVVVSRDVVARLVPAGTMVDIPEGTQVQIVQSLGGSFTINVQGNLLRVDAIDADALGKESQHFDFEPAADGNIKEQDVWEVLKTCFDPEIPVNIVDLGLVYECKIDQDNGGVEIVMTLTAPGCGMGDVLAQDVDQKVRLVPNVKDVHVELTFDPPWSREMLSDSAKISLGLF